MQRYRLNLSMPSEYDILICDVFKSDELSSMIGPSKAFFLIDKGIGDKAIDKIRSYVSDNNIKASIMIMDGGEGAKKLKHVYELLDQMDDFGLDRKEIMVLVGGGAILDLGGFAASIFHRGVEHIRIPTTFLAQNDAGVGVKNGINYREKKNFLGIFQPPKAVLVDPSFLKTLDKRQMKAGMSEALKVALIKDKELFQLIESDYRKILDNDIDSKAMNILWKTIVAHVEQILTDPNEKRLARPLDFGHEWGHRLETVTGHRLNHGEAVAIGIALDSYISYSRCLITKQELERIITLMEDMALPLYDETLKVDNIWQGLEDFRMHLGGELTITLLDGIGNKTDVNRIYKEELEKAIEFVKKRSRK